MTKEKFLNLLNVEIANIVVPLMELEADIDRNNVINEILADHSDDLLSDFANYCGRFTIKSSVDRFFRNNLNNGDKAQDISNQLEFEGFPRVQKYYSIEQDEKLISKSVVKLTDDEAEHIVKHLRSKAKGLNDHADQLIKFRIMIKKSE